MDPGTVGTETPESFIHLNFKVMEESQCLP